MKTVIKITLLLSILVILNFSSCKDEDNPPVEILTLTADALYYEPGTGVQEWVVVWNSDGELLDYQPFTANTTQKFTTTGNVIDNKITLGFVSHIIQDGAARAMVAVYTDLESGETINREILRDRIDAGDPDPYFTVDIGTELPFNSYMISNKYGNPWTSRVNEETSINSFFDSRSDQYLVIVRTDEGLRHAMVNDVKENDVIHLADEDFTPYDNEYTIDIPLSQPQIFTIGYASDVPVGGGGFFMDNYYSSDLKESITTGYLDGISKYSTSISLYYPDSKQSHQYYRYGSLPGTLTWPDKSQFNVTSKDPASFVATAPGDVNMVVAVWRSLQYNVEWNVSSPNLSFKAGKLPDDLLTEYPYLSLPASDFRNATIYVGPAPYAPFSNSQAGGTIADFERYAVMIRN